MSTYHRFIFGMSLLLIALRLIGGGRTPVPTPPFKVSISEVLNPIPSAGDLVHIAWNYENGDLSVQGIELISSNFDGTLQFILYGCLPVRLLPSGFSEDNDCISNEKRTADIKYLSPV